MARPEKNSVDYFPFICEEGKKMYYIEEKYGNDGFATFVKILRELAKTEYHYLDLSKPITMMFLSAKCKVSKEILTSIINDLSDLGKFDSSLWQENKIIWCQDFIDGIQDAYFKRKNKCITLQGLFLLLDSLGVRKLNKRVLVVPDNTQSKVEYSKVDKTKENITTVISVYSSAKAKEIVLRDLEWIHFAGESIPLNKEHFEIAITDFIKHCVIEGKTDDRTIYDFKSHFVRWAKIQIKNKNNPKTERNRQTNTDRL
jgi:hypothetical protein